MIPLSRFYRRQIIHNSYKCSNSVNPDTTRTLFLLTIEHLFYIMDVERTNDFLLFDIVISFKKTIRSSAFGSSKNHSFPFEPPFGRNKGIACTLTIDNILRRLSPSPVGEGRGEVLPFAKHAGSAPKSDLQNIFLNYSFVEYLGDREAGLKAGGGGG